IESSQPGRMNSDSRYRNYTACSSHDYGFIMSQGTRLFWFFLTFFTPMLALFYVSAYGFRTGSEADLFRISLILSLSWAVTLVCVIAQPVAHFRGSSI